MSPGIELQNPLGFSIADERLKQASSEVLALHPPHRNDCLTIILSDAETLRALNRQHRRVDAPTDVLSFVAPALPERIEDDQRYLGDILIAHDYVADSIAARRGDLDDILCLLVIHGTLHLLGYGHGAEAARDRMWAAQASALDSVGIDPSLVSEYADIAHD